MIEIKDLFYSYKDEKIVLKNINISIKKGESVLLAGNNGSGKTTLLNLISKTLKPLIGSIHISGEDLLYIPDSKLHNFVSVLNCNTNHYMVNDLSFIDNLYLHTMHGNKISPFFAIKKDRKLELLNTVKTFNYGIPIDEIAEKKLSDLPNFYKHILALLIGIIHSPQILLIDNFFQTMDAGDIEFVFPILLQICHSEKFTVIFTTDNPFLINKICDRSIIVSNGEIIIDEPLSSTINIINIISMFNHHLEKTTNKHSKPSEKKTAKSETTEQNNKEDENKPAEN